MEGAVSDHLLERWSAVGGGAFGLVNIGFHDGYMMLGAISCHGPDLCVDTLGTLVIRTEPGI